MAARGRAGPALAASAIGSLLRRHGVDPSLIAGFGPPRAAALKLRRREYFSLMVLGLVASIVLAQGSLLHAVGMVVVGLLLGLIGTDVNSGTQRFTFGIFELADGIGFVTVAMGMFGLGEIIRNLENEAGRSVIPAKITGLWPTKKVAADGGADSQYGHRFDLGILLAAADPRVVCRLFDRKSLATRRIRQGAIEAWRRRKQRTMPAPKLPPSRCSPWDSVQPGERAHVGAMIVHGINGAFDYRTAGAVLGHDRFDVDRQSISDRSQLPADRHVGADYHDPVRIPVPGMTVFAPSVCQPEKRHLRFI
jgi:hypothetical protein